MATSITSCLLLLAIPVLWLVGWLSLWTAAALLFLFGVAGLLNAAASQSFLPRLTPKGYLLAANARLDQSSTAAQTTGPVIGGALVAALSAPLTVLVDALSYGIEAALIGRIRIEEPPAAGKRPAPHLLRGIREDLAFIYRHRMLAPLAWSTHVWFVANSIAVTVLAPFALRALGLGALGYGVSLAFAGVGGLAGASLATRVGLRFGAGRAVLAGRSPYSVVVAKNRWTSVSMRRPPMPTPFLFFHARAILARWRMFLDVRSLHSFVALISSRGLVTLHPAATVPG